VLDIEARIVDNQRVQEVFARTGWGHQFEDDVTDVLRRYCQVKGSQTHRAPIIGIETAPEPSISWLSHTVMR